MLELYGKIEAATEAIRARWSTPPRVGIILGTGLGDLAEQIDTAMAVDYDEIPNFPRSTWGGKTEQFYDARQKELGNLLFFCQNKIIFNSN